MVRLSIIAAALIIGTSPLAYAQNPSPEDICAARQSDPSPRFARLRQLCKNWDASTKADQASWAASILALEQRLSAMDAQAKSPETFPAENINPPQAATPDASLKKQADQQKGKKQGPTKHAAKTRLKSPPETQPVMADFSGGEKPATPSLDLPALQDYIAQACDFEAHLWCKLKTANSLKNVAWPTNVEGEPLFRNPNHAIRAFAGATFDGQRLYFHGGGHSASYQNSVYALDLATLKWERLYDPDPLDDRGAFLNKHFGVPLEDECHFPTKEHAPAAGHTWGTPILIDHQIHAWPSAWGCSKYATSYGPIVHSIFDLEKREWVARRPFKKGMFSISAASPIPGRALLLSVKKNPALIEIDLETDAITRRIDRLPYQWGNHAIAILVGDTLVSFNGKDIYTTTITHDTFGPMVRAGAIPAHVEYDDALRYANGYFYLWDGSGNLYRTRDFKAWASFNDGSGPRGLKSLFNKFFYIPKLNAFLGLSNDQDIWLVRPPAETSKAQASLPDGFVCSDFIAGKECQNLQSLVEDGGTIDLPKGIYAQCALIKSPTILNGNGSIIQDMACRNKAALIINADSTIRDIGCRNIFVNDGNGACIRQQTKTLTLDHVTFENAQSGVLTNKDIHSLTVKNSTFQNLGGDCKVKCGRAHGIYYGTNGGTLTIQNSQFLSARHEGHLVKSGAAKLVIENSLFDERKGDGSRVIDAFNGGIISLDTVEIFAKNGDGNRDVIGFGYERRAPLPTHSITITDSRIDCATGWLVHGKIDVEPKIINSPARNCRDVR
ncbi:hypothetical protein GCM10007972_02020 [Iodidimonas muriae]|uniref:Right handed beta helix domain-containing protein n=1 Tax=Iodidimonas muriae TaxID=261467 RepID=A0ABQ2L6C9_9PROT|nr:hypothetical protein [Iodidimonas muriae]GGO05033.1 hypothetical protein GCM10007972_02020 [Iodidimonas muriae]